MYCLTEEPSIFPVVRRVWRDWVLSSLPEDARASAHLELRENQGKQDLKKALRSAAPNLSRIPGARLLILIDQDNSDCLQLKGELQAILDEGRIACPYKIRIVCRELETWFLGDPEAIGAAFPRFNPGSVINRPEFKKTDALQNPPERLLRLIPEYQSDKLKTLPKIQTAEKISPHLSRERNRSHSFGQFINAAIDLVRQP